MDSPPKVKLGVPSIDVIQGVPESHRGCSFENFDFVDNSALFSLATNFLGFQEGGSFFWLYLQGEPGRGKTHFAVALYKALAARLGWVGSDSCVFVEFRRLIEELKASLADYSYDEVLNSFCEAECLILDDVIGKFTDFEMKSLESLIRERHASHRRLVITSNEDFGNFLSLFSAHEVSRIQEVCVQFKFAGLDRRR